MSFFNSLHFLLEIGLSTAGYISLLRLFPKLRAEIPLLLLSVFWTYSFLNVPVEVICALTGFYVAYFYAATYFTQSQYSRFATVVLLATVILLWMSLRFPLTSEFLHIPAAKSSPFFRSKTIFMIGVPYTACRLISFVVDMNRKKFERPSLVRFLLYILYFPTRISGPVTGYQHFINVNHRIEWNRYINENLFPGAQRIIIGVLKREVVSEVLSAIALPFIFVDRSSRWQLILGAYVYYFYLYVDFSGYSDLAIGFSRILGIEIPENFDRPFLARNPKDFWRRWHISLLDWLNEYVLTPVYSFLLIRFSWVSAGILSFFAIFITMGFAGIWHGEERRYLYYGLFNATVLWAYREFDNYLRANHHALRKRLNESPVAVFVSRALCFHYVVFALMIFSLDPAVFRTVLQRIWNG